MRMSDQWMKEMCTSWNQCVAGWEGDAPLAKSADPASLCMWTIFVLRDGTVIVTMSSTNGAMIASTAFADTDGDLLGSTTSFASMSPGHFVAFAHDLIEAMSVLKDMLMAQKENET